MPDGAPAVSPAATWFAHYFATLPDPRRVHQRRHELLDILTIALLTLLCGADTFVDMERFGRAKQNWLKERLGLSLAAGVPAHDTFGRVFSRLDPQAFAQCFTTWTQALQDASGGQIIALDGKTLRHSFDTSTGQQALHLVCAWAAKSRLVLGQVRVEGKPTR
jgi:hypothetical protein